MIYTVTFNPALDYLINLSSFNIGEINKSKFESIHAGGKGINVSIVLKHLGYENTALGFIAGFSGDEIKRQVEKAGCIADFIVIDNGISRININVKYKEETQLCAQSPFISQEKVDILMNKLDKLVDGDILVLAGSIPDSVSDSIYKEIMIKLKSKKVDIIVDATKDLLINTLNYHPFLIKPNNFELSEIFGVDLKTKEDVIPYAKKMQEKGARNVLVSMAGEGAVLLAESGEILLCDAPKGIVKNSVGAGDSMVAGFIAGWLEKHDYNHAFKLGISAGSASAFSEFLATKKEVADIYSSLII